MIVKNVTKKTIVISGCFDVTSFIDSCLGLLNPSLPRSLLLHTRWGIHTFFLKEPIDVMVLDDQNKIVKIHSNLPPFSLFFWDIKYSKILELPRGVLIKSSSELGDQLLFEYL